MSDKATIIAGIVIPSDSPFFLAMVGLHVVVALTCVITGVVAMLSHKRPGQHPLYGTIYYWGLALVFASATVLAAVRWPEDNHLFVLGMFSFAVATLGRTARQRRWHSWARLHIAGMGGSYIVLLVAFYIDNGKKPTTLEGASTDCILAHTDHDRRATRCPRFAEPPAGATPTRVTTNGLSMVVPSAPVHTNAVDLRVACLLLK